MVRQIFKFATKIVLVKCNCQRVCQFIIAQADFFTGRSIPHGSRKRKKKKKLILNKLLSDSFKIVQK